MNKILPKSYSWVKQGKKMLETNIYLIRHGQTKWNLEKRWQGSLNADLTQEGIAQAYCAKDLMQEITLHKAYVSPLKRTQDTIAIILKESTLEAICMDGLKEISLGVWEGKTQEEIKKDDPKQSHNFWNESHLFDVVGAESFFEVQNRMIKVLDSIFKENIGKNILVVSHWVAIKVALAHYLQKDLSELSSIADPKNAQILCLQKTGEKVSIL